MKKILILISIILLVTGCVALAFSNHIDITYSEDTAVNEDITATPSPEPTAEPMVEPTAEPTLEPVYFNNDEFYFVDDILAYDGGYYGIDVSGYQGEINWDEVEADFAIIRLGYRGTTSGDLFDDSYFEANIKGATEAGIKIGVYFFSQSVTEAEAVEEAQYVLEKIQDYTVDYPIVIDWEYTSAEDSRTSEVTGAEVTNSVIAFMDYVSSFGYNTAVYLDDSHLEGFYVMEDLEGYDLWYANYDGIPTTDINYTILQYSNTGKTQGIVGNVDQNISVIDYTFGG